MTQGYIVELSDSDKTPGFYGKVKFGVGANTTTGVYRLLLVGLLASGSTMTVDTAAVRCSSVDEARALAGFGGELCRGAEAALSVPGIDGIELWLAAATEPSGGTKATATITITGTWSTSGAWRYRIGGEEISDGITATDTLTTVAVAIAAYITARPWLPVTAAADTGVVTLTMKAKTARGNSTILVQDISQLPSGASSAIAGGASTTSGGVRFASGASQEDLSTLLGVLYPTRFHTICAAVIDATNVGRLETHIDNAAGYDAGRRQHLVLGMNNAAQSGVTSIAQTTLDNQRTQMMWMIDGETIPFELAARNAAIRTILEQGNPNQDYDGYPIPGVRPQIDSKGTPIVASHATKKAALDAGITIVETTPAAQAVVVRGITTRTQDASGNVDDKTVDVGESRTPDRVLDDVETFWASSFKPQNKNVRDDPAANEPDPPAGVAYPKLWTREMTKLLLDRQALGWITKVESNPPKSAFNRTAKRIVSRIPVVVTPINHQIETSVEQVPYSSAL